MNKITFMNLFTTEEIDEFEDQVRWYFNEIIRANLPENLHAALSVENKHFASCVEQIVQFKFEYDNNITFSKNVVFEMFEEFYKYVVTTTKSGVIIEANFSKTDWKLDTTD